MQTILTKQRGNWPHWTMVGLVGAWLTACQATHPLPEQLAATALAQGCKPIQRDMGFIPVKGLAKGGGRQCLVQDLVQRNVRALDDGSNVGSPGSRGIVEFYNAKDLDLDLQGHRVSGKPFDDTVGVLAYNPFQGFGTHLRVHNGLIETPGLYGLGVSMGQLRTILDYAQTLPAHSKFDREDEEPSGGLSQNKPIRHTYPISTRYVAENLTIRSGGRGIIMVGADNVVRNNVIESDGKVAVYLYGPRPVIEGNTFILYLDPRDTTSLPAAIKLRDADGAIIRNNRFIIKAGFFTGLLPGKAEAAINLLTSKDVLIENNTIEDTRQLVRKDDASTTIERENK